MSLLELLARARRPERRSSFGPTVVGMGFGMTIGFFAGLLLAPRTGQATREQLGRDVKEAAARIKGSMVDAAEIIKDKYGAEETEQGESEVKEKKQVKH